MKHESLKSMRERFKRKLGTDKITDKQMISLMKKEYNLIQNALESWWKFGDRVKKKAKVPSWSSATAALRQLKLDTVYKQKLRHTQTK